MTNDNGVSPERKTKIGTMQLSVIIFYAVSGGPFGIEEAVRSGGYLYALLGFLLLPVIWSIPEALVVAELGSAFPEASGTVAWVETAFDSPLWGWLQGCLTWVSGATDNAIYPVLFLEYATQIFGYGEVETGWLRFGILSTTCLILAAINFRGLAVVGDMSITICILSMSPFLVFMILAIPKIEPSRWLGTRSDATILWGPFLNNLFWNLNSFDSAACFAGQVSDPGKSFPKAMLYAVLLVVLCYFLPLLVATGAAGVDVDSSDWVDGYIAVLISNTIGKWLGGWVVFAALISNLALFQAEMSSDAYQILGMAERGYLPKIFAQRSQYDTPTAGIILGTIVILIMCVSDLTALIEMLNFNYAASLLLEYVAFIKLRISHDSTLHRPFRIPLSTGGCIVMIIPPFLLTLVIMGLATYVTYIYSAVTLSIAMGIYVLRRDSFRVEAQQHVENEEGQELVQEHVVQLPHMT